MLDDLAFPIRVGLLHGGHIYHSCPCTGCARCEKKETVKQFLILKSSSNLFQSTKSSLAIEIGFSFSSQHFSNEKISQVHSKVSYLFI